MKSKSYDRLTTWLEKFDNGLTLFIWVQAIFLGSLFLVGTDKIYTSAYFMLPLTILLACVLQPDMERILEMFVLLFIGEVLSVMYLLDMHSLLWVSGYWCMAASAIAILRRKHSAKNKVSFWTSLWITEALAALFCISLYLLHG